MAKWARGLGEGLASVGKTLLDDALLRRRDELLGKMRAEEQAKGDAAADARLDKELKHRSDEGAKDRASRERQTKMETDARSSGHASVQIDELTKINYNKKVDPVTGETTIGEPSSVEILDPRDGTREVVPWADYVRLKSAKPSPDGKTPPPASGAAPATPSAAPSAAAPPRPMSSGIDTRTPEEKRRAKLQADADKVKKAGLLSLPGAPISVSAGGPSVRYPTS